MMDPAASKDQVRRKTKTILNPTHHGETDFLYSLTNASHDSILIYLQNRLGVCAIWMEQKTDLFQLESANLTKDELTDLPSKIKFNQKDYLKQEICYGKQFVTDSRVGAPVQQCVFVREEQTGSLRLLKRSQSALSAFAGTPAQAYQFSNILPK